MSYSRRRVRLHRQQGGKDGAALPGLEPSGSRSQKTGDCKLLKITGHGLSHRGCWDGQGLMAGEEGVGHGRMNGWVDDSVARWMGGWMDGRLDW